MKYKRLDSNKSDFQIEFKSGIVTRRKTGFLSDGAYYFEEELKVEGFFTAKVITCTAWLIEFYDLSAGEIYFLQGEKQICPQTKNVGVFYPPFTISQPCFKNPAGRLRGIAADSLPEKFLSAPIMFETALNETPASIKQVIEILEFCNNPQSIEINPKPSLLSLKAKRMIDENYLVYPSIARIADKIGVTHEHLSRQFKRDYGLTPSAYLHQLRLADAPLKLASGEEIVNVSQEVGYNDLSRFYKQFHKNTKTSPGVCQTMMKPHSRIKND
ncbi:MAG: AraC family transcriptional regulator [Acidobacteriota bacterium]|nr:AraC family transcriptional regulator [Acidobacteriota bacterium]